MTALAQFDPMVAALVAHHSTGILLRAEPKIWFWITEDHGPSTRKLILVSDIQQAVADYFGLTTHDLVSDRRSKKEVMPRHIAMYLCRTLTKRPYEMIARLFHRTDHSVAMHAIAKISRLVETDASVAADVAKITRVLA